MTVMFRVFVDPGSLAESRGGSVTGRLHIDSEIGPFPEEDWWDFPPVVLAWWLVAIRASGGQPFVLRFMDGPFRVACEADGTQVSMRFLRSDRSGDVEVGAVATSMTVMEAAITKAAGSVARRCLSEGLPTGGLDQLVGMTS